MNQRHPYAGSNLYCNARSHGVKVNPMIPKKSGAMHGTTVSMSAALIKTLFGRDFADEVKRRFVPSEVLPTYCISKLESRAARLRQHDDKSNISVPA